ncbi:MAG: DUF4244 domain-containing protein [Candidatus Nanopelagicales bacterium]
MSAMRAKLAVVRSDDSGISTAEYAVGTVAACGFAGVLWKLLSSDAGTDLLFELIKKALTFLV